MSRPSESRWLPRGWQLLQELLEFHPWMLAMAVFLACAIGVAVMEQVRAKPPVLAQASPPAQVAR